MWLPLSTGVEPAELANSASIPRRPTASIHRHRATSIGAQGERAGRKALSELDTKQAKAPETIQRPVQVAPPRPADGRGRLLRCG
jgi:hypothetical protein